jgi:hypothetical protein
MENLAEIAAFWPAARWPMFGQTDFENPAMTVASSFWLFGFGPGKPPHLLGLTEVF